MVVELPPQLVNQGFITPEGEMAHTLARVDRTLSNHNNPEISFAMSPAMIESHRTERDRQMKNLGIEEDPDTAERISQIRSELEAQGSPDWRMINVEPHPGSSQK